MAWTGREQGPVELPSRRTLIAPERIKDSRYATGLDHFYAHHAADNLLRWQDHLGPGVAVFAVLCGDLPGDGVRLAQIDIAAQSSAPQPRQIALTVKRHAIDDKRCEVEPLCARTLWVGAFQPCRNDDLPPPRARHEGVLN